MDEPTPEQCERCENRKECKCRGCRGRQTVECDRYEDNCNCGWDDEGNCFDWYNKGVEGAL